MAELILCVMKFLSPENAERVRLQVEQEFTCLHGRSALTLQLRKGDKKFYRTQCLACGYIVKELRRSELSEAEIQSAIRFDDALSTEFWKRRNERYAELEAQTLAKQQTEFDERYAAYLSSEQWRRIRAKVLQRDKQLCQGCLINRATDVHHLTYQRLYNELMFDLISLCRDCHEQLHPEHSLHEESAYGSYND